MSAGLRSTTYNKLVHFCRRRRQLFSARWLAAVVFVSITLLLCSVVVDAMFALPNAWRVALATAVYLVSGLVAIIGLLPLFKRFTIHQAAQAIEPLVPDLQHQLLSAVELAKESEDPKHGSIAFREQLQHQVAECIAWVRVPELLPWRLIQRWLALGVTALMLLVALCLVPQLKLPQRILRVMFPMANIARPSLAAIDILKPSPASTIVPMNEIVRFEVSVKPPFGQSSKTATLEIQPSRDKADAVSKVLNTSDSRQPSVQLYSGNWMIDESDVRYRVVTDVGETPWFELTAKPRPKVLQFHKTIEQPSYAETPSTMLTEEHGDIEAVIGAKVTLAIDTNIPTASAELHFQAEEAEPESKTVTPFLKSADGLWSIELPITASGKYQVHLVATDSGLTNTFSPTYRMIAAVDQPPKLRWTQPESRQLVSRSTASNIFRVDLKDEFPVSVLQQWIRINRGEWTETSNRLDASTAPDIAWNHELYGWNLKRGDLVESKVVAVDRLGQQGETELLEIVISDAELEATREPGTLLRESLSEQVRLFAQQATEQRDALQSIREAWNGAQDDPTKSASLKQQLQEAVKPLADKAEQLRDAVQQAATQMDNPVSLDELERAADALSKIDRELAKEVEILTDDNANNDHERTRDEKAKIQQALSSTDQLVHLAQRLDDRFRKFVAHDVLADLARDLRSAQEYQQDLSRNPSELGSEAWKREELLLAEHMKKMSKEMDQQAQYLPDGSANQLRQWSQWADQLSQTIAQMADQPNANSDEGKQQIKQQMQNVQNEFKWHQSIQNLNSNSSNESIEGRRELRQMNGLASDVLSKAIDEVSQRLKSADHPGLDQAAVSALDQIADRREMQLARTDASGTFAADLGNAYRAVQSILQSEASDPEARLKELRSVAEATKKIEALEEIERAEKLLDKLIETERWSADGMEARTESPRIWDAVSDQIGNAAQQVRASGLSNEAADVLDRTRWSPAAGQAGQKITMRRWNPDESATAALELETMREKLAEAKSQIENAVSEARDSLRELAPSIPELARAAAETANRAESQAQKIAESHAKGEVPNLPSRLSEARQEQEAESNAANQLQEALTDLAASQDLLASNERNLARDADLSRELTQAAVARVEQAMNKAETAPTGETNQRLSQLAEAQNKAADTFEAIAEHFERVNDLDAAPQEIAQSRDRLQQMNDSSTPSPAQQQYDAAERLERLANADPRALLKRLEKELATNPEMREALSDIAENLTNQSKDALDFAAQRERAMRSALEGSDQAFELQKNQTQQELTYLADQANRVIQRLGNEAQGNASNAGQQQRQQQLQQAAEKLNKAVEATRQVNQQSPLSEIQTSAQNLAQALKEAQPQLQDAAQGLANAAQEKKFENDDQRKNAKSQLENSQNQLRDQDVRWADLNVQWREQRKQQADRNVANLDQQLNQARQNRDQAKSNADQNQQSEDAKKNLAEAEARVGYMESVKQIADTQQQLADQKLNEARAERERATAQPGPLDSQNPNAELASRLAEQASNRSAELARATEQLANSVGFKDQLQAAQQQLANAVNDQRAVQESVVDAAQSLDRASAHEQRLNQPENAKALQELAQRVAGTANNEARNAAQQLDQASQSPAANSPSHRASPQASTGAQQSVMYAENAIRQRSQELDKALSDLADSEAPSQLANESAEPAQASKSPLDAQTMAKMLDELDSQLRSPKGQLQNNRKSNAGDSPAAVTSAALKEAAQSLASQLNQSRQSSSKSNQNTPSQQSNSQSNSLVSSSAAADPASSKVSAIDVTDLQGEPIGAWSRLREQKAEEVADSQREAVSPRYRRQIEAYFRTLSEKSQGPKK